MKEFKESDAVFLQRLTSLLNSEVRTKTKDAENAEEFSDALKWQLAHYFEEALKIDALPDDFSFAPFITEHVNYPIERIKEQIEKPWLKDKLTIGLLGHFSTGKTTALNLILSENLPTNENENTALAAYLINGKNGEMSIVTKSGQTLVLKAEDSKALDYVEGRKRFPFARIFNYIVKENESQILKKLTFIDTPGLGRSFQHSEPTISALQSCDAVIWFIKGPDSISKDDIKFIQDNIGKRTLYVVISFIDECENLDKSIDVIKTQFSKANIAVKDYFLLGESASIQSEFRKKITDCLKKASEKHEVYNPYAHIYSVISFLEETLIKYNQIVTKKYNNLNKETNSLVEAYQQSRQTFVTEFNTCCKIMSNVITTFNNRCSGAAFCGGASSAICNLLNSYQESFIKMSNADDAIDIQKLVDFGYEASRMSFYEFRTKQAAEIIEKIQKLKKRFESHA